MTLVEKKKKKTKGQENDVSVDDVNDDEKKMCRRKKQKWNTGMHVKKSLKKGRVKQEYSYKTFLFDRWINTMDF